MGKDHNPPLEIAMKGLKVHTRDYLLEYGFESESLASGPYPPREGQETGGVACLSDVPYLAACNPSSPPKINHGKIRVTHFRRGALLTYGVVPKKKKQSDATRGECNGMSDRSRQRLLWVLANCGQEWAAMVTLTYPHDEFGPKFGLRTMFKRLKRMGAKEWLWVQECTQRGRLHYHIILSRSPLTERLNAQEIKGGKRDRYAGSEGKKIGAAWVEIIKPRLTPDQLERAIAFNAGGIAEPLRHVDSAEKYMGKELGKRIQKDYPGGGRWWGVSEGVKCESVCSVEYWPEEISLRKNVSRVWDWAHAAETGFVT